MSLDLRDNMLLLSFSHTTSEFRKWTHGLLQRYGLLL